MAVDGLLFAASYFLAFRLRLDVMAPQYLQTIALTVGPVVLLKIAVYHLMGSYRSIWRYSSLTDLEELTRATLACTVVVVGIGFSLPEGLNLPRSVPFIDMTSPAAHRRHAHACARLARIVGHQSSGRSSRWGSVRRSASSASAPSSWARATRAR
jgi:FlaA1/EpsC-like NDP-sugar epimerase